MESTNKLTEASKPAPDELSFLSALAFLIPVGREPNSIPFLATLKFLKIMHHVEVFALVLDFVQV
jgi:hypothetical protein